MGLSTEAMMACLLSLQDLAEFDFGAVNPVGETDYWVLYWKTRFERAQEQFLAEKSRREVLEARLKVLEG